MPTGDHPGIPFLEARKSSGAPMYTRGRPDGPPLWIVVHDMEEEETSRTAEAVALYFHNGAGGRSVSSHYCADADSIVQCVPLADSAWTVGNRLGNNRGINWEFAGFASQSRKSWLDAYGRAMFARAAPIIRADAVRFSIPLRTLTDAEVKAYRPGVTSHWQLGRVFGGTDHQDPGPNFPWDYFIALLNDGTQEDDVALRDDPDGRALIERVENMHNLDLGIPADAPNKGEGSPLVVAIRALLASAEDTRKRLEAIEKALGAGGTGQTLAISGGQITFNETKA